MLPLILKVIQTKLVQTALKLSIIFLLSITAAREVIGQIDIKDKTEKP